MPHLCRVALQCPRLLCYLIRSCPPFFTPPVLPPLMLPHRLYSVAYSSVASSRVVLLVLPYCVASSNVTSSLPACGSRRATVLIVDMRRLLRAGSSITDKINQGNKTRPGPHDTRTSCRAIFIPAPQAYSSHLQSAAEFIVIPLPPILPYTYVQ